MKGGIAVAAHAARLLAGGDRPFARLELVSVPDEEVRSEPIATQARLAGFDAVLCMECGRPGGAVVAARKGGRWLDVVARGRSAHAGSEPEHGRNAVLALARELPRIAALDRAREGLTLHVTRMHGGDVLNSVPGEARATIDMRGWHEADLDWAEAQLLRCDQHRGIAFTRARGVSSRRRSSARPRWPPSPCRRPRSGRARLPVSRDLDRRRLRRLLDGGRRTADARRAGPGRRARPLPGRVHRDRVAGTALRPGRRPRGRRRRRPAAVRRGVKAHPARRIARTTSI